LRPSFRQEATTTRGRGRWCGLGLLAHQSRENKSFGGERDSCVISRFKAPFEKPILIPRRPALDSEKKKKKGIEAIGFSRLTNAYSQEGKMSLLSPLFLPVKQTTKNYTNAGFWRKVLWRKSKADGFK